MKSRKKWRHINVDRETINILERPIIDSSQQQIDSNEAYDIDLDGDDYNITKYKSKGIKHVIKSHQKTKSLKGSFELNKIKKLANKILSKNPQKQHQNPDDVDFDVEYINLDDESPPKSQLLLPFNGQSYNPSIEDHQDHLMIAAEQIDLENRDKNEQDSENYLKPMTAQLKEQLPDLDIDSLTFKTKQRLLFILNQDDENKMELINECINNDGDDNNDMNDPVISAVPRSKRSLKRKTKADKNKKERLKMLKLTDKEKNRIKSINKSIDDLDEIIKECDEQDRIKEERRRKKELIKNVSLALKKKGLVKIKQGNKRHWPESVKDVALSDELATCLRHIKPVSGIKTVQNQHIEKGLMNIPPEINKQYESNVKYDVFMRNTASKMLNTSRELKNDFNDNSNDIIEPEITKSEDKITSLI